MIVIIDFRTADAPSEFDTDICVIGAGPAGITIARSFLGCSVRVCLVESGGLAPHEDTQELCNGAPQPHPRRIDLVGSRARRFGGTTDPWGGGCIPLDDLDFQVRSWVPYSGWPISRQDLNPFYERARPIVEIADTPFDDEDILAQIATRHAFDPDKLRHQYGLPSRTKFGARYYKSLEQAPNVTVLLYANLTELRPGSVCSAIKDATVSTLDGKRGQVKARCFILACGGIENARLLMLSNSVAINGLGNQNDLVGRFFMDHPSGSIGVISTKDPTRLTAPYDRFASVKGRPARPEITLSQVAQSTARILNARIRPQIYEDAIPDGILALRELKSAARAGTLRNVMGSNALRVLGGLHSVVGGLGRKLLGKPVVRSSRIECEMFFEQAPNPQSRVMLSADRDALGQRKVCLEWRLSSIDLHTHNLVADIFSGELERTGLGQLDSGSDGRTGMDFSSALVGTAHHLGTTRMSDDPRSGVVDRQCRVHGIDNLYVAGSSVFPTGGWAWPTFTIVALALRLADHLKGRLTADA